MERIGKGISKRVSKASLHCNKAGRLDINRWASSLNLVPDSGQTGPHESCRELSFTQSPCIVMGGIFQEPPQYSQILCRKQTSVLVQL